MDTTIENKNTPYVPPRVADVNARIASTGLGYQPAPSVLSSANITPQTPLSIPTIPQTNAASALSGATDATVQSGIDKQLQAKEQAQLTAKDKSFTDYEKTINEILGVQKSRGGLEEQANIGGLSTLSNDSFTALQASKRAEKAETEAALRASGGTLAGTQDTLNAIRRKYALEQADLSVTFDVANRNLANAQATVDRKIQLQLEPLQTLIQFQDRFYQENKDAFTKTEDRRFNLMMDKNKRELDKEEKKFNTLENTKLKLLESASQQGASSSIVKAIQSAKTPEEAVISAGIYGGDIMERELQKIQYKNIQDQIRERNVATEDGGIVTTSGGFISKKKMTAGEAVASGFANRTIEANKVIDEIGDKFSSIGGFFSQIFPSAVQSEERQKFEQAKRNFINAILRKESGAVISTEEFRNAELQYFPQPGDKKGTLEQKRQNRVTSINGLLVQSGLEPVEQIKDPLGLGVQPKNNPLGI